MSFWLEDSSSVCSGADVLARRVEWLGSQTSARCFQDESQESGFCAKENRDARNTGDGILWFILSLLVETLNAKVLG